MITPLYETLDQLILNITKLLVDSSASWVMIPNSICHELCVNPEAEGEFTQLEKKDGCWAIKEIQ